MERGPEAEAAETHPAAFVELRNSEPKQERQIIPDQVECYVASVEPENCGKALRDLSSVLPLRVLSEQEQDAKQKDETATEQQEKIVIEGDVCLGHLKRVRRPKLVAAPEPSAGSTAMIGTSSNPSTRKRRRSSGSSASSSEKAEKRPQKRKDPGIIEIVVGTRRRVDRMLNTSSSSTASDTGLARILDRYNLKLETRYLPGRPAKSQDELDKWNGRVCATFAGVGWWPTIFFSKRTNEYKEEELKLTDKEIHQMQVGLEAAVADAKEAKRLRTEAVPTNKIGIAEIALAEILVPVAGVALVDPQNGNIVATASDERKAREEMQIPDDENPLCTSIILAIQGVARKERNSAIRKGMESNDFKSGQYLCTGYDIYTTKEPDVFEAMSLVHSRIRRVIFGIPNAKAGGLGGARESTSVNSLPGTNHHYRVFHCIAEKLVSQCIAVHGTAHDMVS